MPYNTAIAYIQSLCAIPSPTGFTKDAENFVFTTLQEMGFSPWKTPKGTVLCSLGGQTHPLLLSCHIDTLGAMVRSIKPTGRLRYTQIGGYNVGSIENENCLVHTRQGKTFSGTFQHTNASRHVYGSTDTINRTDETLEVVLDELVSSEDDVKHLGIRPGDYISFDPRTLYTSSGYLKSRHLDDKASAGILLSIADLVAKKELLLSRNITLMFTVFEEIGHGASPAFSLPVEDMIAVDMGCVGDDLSCKETMVSICAKDSSGPYHYDLTNELISLAENEGIDYAVDIYPRYASDASAAMEAGLDVRHALIGPGVFASHGYERTHRLGIENTLNLLKAYISLPKK
ncbi:MAG: M42 family metallopeptidase [Clostridiales bacterium]|nr:M42 family metallopeptidase [Clostridiales bacterium]